MKRKLRVGVLGATGMVGQRFVSLLENHPWFEVTCLAASPQSAGHIYSEAVKTKWRIDKRIPDYVKKIRLNAVEKDFNKICKEVDFVFSALDLEKDKIKEIEIKYAKAGIPVVSNNSAHRWSEDVPMIMPEVNADHLELIKIQQKNRGFNKGFIVVKPNCSIQSYVTILTALKKYRPTKISVTSLQSISGAGRTFDLWPEMVDNIIPFIKGEEEKSEKEPLKIWGNIKNGFLQLANKPVISATCVRVPTLNGHMAVVSVKFEKKPGKTEFLKAIEKFCNPSDSLKLPSSPEKLIRYFEEDDRPQSKLDRNYDRGMGITIGRLREDTDFDWKFIALSHNTVRGAAGGAIMVAELLKTKGYL